MWTDGRYYLQAGKQLNEGWVMMKMEADMPTWFGWIKDNLKVGDKIGLDFTQYPAYMLDVRFKDIKAKGITLVSTPNLVDIVWGDARPARPVNKIFHLEAKYTGLTTNEKLKKVIDKLGSGVDCMLVTSLDEIAWLLNMRGTDIAYNPVFFSYVILYPDLKIDLFMDESKAMGDTSAYLESINVTVKKYGEIDLTLQALTEDGKKIGVDTKKCNSKLHAII